MSAIDGMISSGSGEAGEAGYRGFFFVRRGVVLGGCWSGSGIMSSSRESGGVLSPAQLMSPSSVSFTIHESSKLLVECCDIPLR